MLMIFFQFCGRLVRFAHYEKLYYTDSQSPYRCCPKFTHAHFYMTNFQKMNVARALQVTYTLFLTVLLFKK